MNHTLLSAAPPLTPHWRHWLRQPVSRGRWRRWRRLLLLAFIPPAIAVCYHYLVLFSTATLIGALALLYTPSFEKDPPGSFRFGWLALAFIALFFLLPVRTTLFLALAATAGLLRESFHRRVPPTMPIILGLMTPIMGYFVETFSFPIRLRLTSVAGKLISLSGLPTAVDGNAITFRNHAFTIDPACVGLHMLTASLLTGMLLMNYYQSQFRRRLPVFAIFLLLLLVAGLNILANLLRIICLVALGIGPENPLHGILGIVFLLTYILLPLLPLTRLVIRRWGAIPSPPPPHSQPIRSRSLLAGNILVITGMILLVLLSRSSEQAHSTTLRPGLTLPGYSIKEVENSVLQLDNGRSLVYIKPIPGFYYTDHTPTLCWQGSGYSFGALRETTIEGTHIYEGILDPPHQPNPASGEHQPLYTAWWYDNGIRQTTSNLDWRCDLLRGAPPYSVINITATTRQQLLEEVRSALQTHPFRKLLGAPVAPASVKIW